MRCAFVLKANKLWNGNIVKRVLTGAYQQGERPKVQKAGDPGANRQRWNTSVAWVIGLHTPNPEGTQGLCVRICYIWAPYIFSKPTSFVQLTFLKAHIPELKTHHSKWWLLSSESPCRGDVILHTGVILGYCKPTSRDKVWWAFLLVEVQLWLGFWAIYLNLIRATCGQPGYVVWGWKNRYKFSWCFLRQARYYSECSG